MANKPSVSFSDYFFKHRIILLLITILCFIIGGPFVDDIFHFGIIPDIFLTIVFIFGIYAISLEKKNIYIGLFLAAPMFFAIWSSHLFKSLELFAIGELFGAFFVGFVISLLVKFIFNEKEVTKEIIFAAVVVYLLIGIMWSFAYFILDYFYPDSFSFPENTSPNVYRYLYFSYVTLTTLGYGDVAPLTNKAGSLVILEAITGQIYLVVIVAWLVGMHVSRRSR
jgi:hypothetical protein